MTIVPVRAFLLAFAAASVVLAAVPLASALLGLPMPSLTRDATAVADIHPLTGMLSNLGILGWWTSACVWLFAAALHWRWKNGLFWFAFSSGLLSAYLALDDLFLIHEHLLPRYLGMAEEVVYGLIALAVLLYLLTFRRVLRRQRDDRLLLLSLGLLAASVGLDVMPQAWLTRLDDGRYFVEDGLKWFGVFFWASFCVVRCSNDLAGGFSVPTNAVRQRQIDGSMGVLQPARTSSRGRPPKLSATSRKDVCIPARATCGRCKEIDSTPPHA